MANEHPFQMLFETLGRLPIAHAESVNRQAYEILYDILSVPVEKPGRCILLRAPRAGHGKTHLLSRIQHHLGASHEFIPLHASFGCQIDAATVIDDSLRRLLRPLPASGGLTVLDLVARRLFATALQPLVGSGEVPCQDREGALTALRTRPIETFDFHHPNAVTAHWARENFEVLGQRLSVELSQRSGLPAREVAFWVDALFRFAATPVENPVRLRVLAEAIHAGNPVDNVLMERLEALLGLLAQLMRVVLVADDLEGFSTDESAALRLAAFLGSLRQSVERLDVILSLNQDIWQSAFLPRLSGGLADRLSEVVVELNPLTEDEMVALLESRVPGLGARVLSRVDRESAGTHARGLIRAAGVAWLRASATDTQPAPPSVPAVVPVVAASVLPEIAPIVVDEPPVFEIAPEPPPVVLAPEPPPVIAVPEPPPVIAAPEPPPVIAAPEPPPVVAALEPPPVEIPVVQPEPEPAPVERAPDPTLAIAFLAAEAGVKPEPDPVEVAPPVFEAVVSEPEVKSPFEPAFTVPEPVIPEPRFAMPPAESPFQAAPAFVPPPEVPANVFEPAEPVQSAYGSAPVAEFQPVTAPVFEAAPDPEPGPAFVPAPPSPVFEAAPEPPPVPAFEPAPEPAKPSVPDTDRVDDLLRQFRERYGRGSM